MATSSKKVNKERPNGGEIRVIILGHGLPTVARIHHTPETNYKPDEAAEAFRISKAALQCLKQTAPLPLLAGAGFARVNLNSLTALRRPNSDEFALCLEEARKWLAVFSKDAACLGHHALFGLDVFAGCERRPMDLRAVAQFIVHFDPETKEAILVASKRLPSPDEASYLCCDERPTGLPRTLNIPGLGMVLPLICNDMNVCNPRGTSCQDPHGEQAGRRRDIESNLKHQEIKIAFASIHSLGPAALTFKVSIDKLEEKYQNIKALAAFGTVKDSLSRVLEIAARHTPDSLCSAELIPESWQL